MNKLFYFVLGLSLPFLIAATSQIGGKYSNSNEVEREFSNIYQALSKTSFDVQTSTPSVEFMKEGQGFFVYSGNVLSFVTKVNGSRYFVNLIKL